MLTKSPTFKILENDGPTDAPPDRLPGSDSADDRESATKADSKDSARSFDISPSHHGYNGHPSTSLGLDVGDSPSRGDEAAEPLAPSAKAGFAHGAPGGADRRFPAGFTEASSPQLPSRRATRSADPQASHRTLTGLRFAVVDESASCIGAGEL